MGLVTCVDCGEPFSDRARACPKCGGPNDGPTRGETGLPVGEPLPATALPAIPAGDIPAAWPAHREVREEGDKIFGKEKREPRGKEALYLTLSALIAGAALGWWSSNGVGDLAAMAGYAVGTASIPLVIALVVLWLRNSNAAWKTLFVLFALVALGVWNAQRYDERARERANVHAETASLREDMARSFELNDKLRNGELPAPKSNESVPTKAPVSGGVAQTEVDVIRLTRKYFNEANAELTTTMTALAAEESLLPIETLLAPRTLVSAEGIRSGHRTLEQYGEIVNKREAAIKRYGDSMATNFRAAIPADRFPAFWQNYEPSSKSRDELAAEMIQNQRDLVTTINSILELMGTQVGHTQVGNDQILFEDVAVMNEYNSLMAEFTRLAGDEAKLQTRLEAQNKRAMEMVDQLAGSR